MEEVELFLAPLTARSKVREVLRGLVATRQVHTISLGHAPHFYVAGTLPEFAAAPTVYASSSMPASAYFLRSYEREDVPREPASQAPVAATSGCSALVQAKRSIRRKQSNAQRTGGSRAQAGSSRRPHLNSAVSLLAPADRKPTQSSSDGRVPGIPAQCSRPGSTFQRTADQRQLPSCPTARWAQGAAKNGSKRHSAKSSSGSSRFRANGNGHADFTPKSAQDQTRRGEKRCATASQQPGESLRQARVAGVPARRALRGARRLAQCARQPASPPWQHQRRQATGRATALPLRSRQRSKKRG